MSEPTENPLRSMEQAAEQLQLSAQQVKQWARSGYLTGAKKIGKFWRIRQKDLDAFIENPPRWTEVNHQPPDATGVPETPAPMPAAPAAKVHAQTRAQLIRRIEGLVDEGFSLREVAERLNAEGVPTFSGKGRWQRGTLSNLLAKKAATS